MKKNLVQARSFREMLEKTIRKYTHRTIEAAEVIEELITIAKTMHEERDRGKHLNFSEEEIAFYDALGVNDSAVKILGDKILRQIAIELTKTIRQNVTLDWALRESVQARLRVLVKRVLRRNSQRLASSTSSSHQRMYKDASRSFSDRYQGVPFPRELGSEGGTYPPVPIGGRVTLGVPDVPGGVLEGI